MTQFPKRVTKVQSFAHDWQYIWLSQYEMDGTNEKGLQKVQCNSTAPEKKTTSAYVQLSVKIAKLKKVSKSVRKH